MFMYRWIRKDTVFPAYLEALESWAIGNTSWNPGAVHSYGGQFQSCYTLNFVFPSQNSVIKDRRSITYNSVLTSTLIYTRSLGPLEEPFYLAVSDSIRAREVIESAARWSAKTRGVSSYPAFMAFHAYLAYVSSEGWSYVLLGLEYEVSFLFTEPSSDLTLRRSEFWHSIFTKLH